MGVVVDPADINTAEALLNKEYLTNADIQCIKSIIVRFKESHITHICSPVYQHRIEMIKSRLMERVPNLSWGESNEGNG